MLPLKTGDSSSKTCDKKDVKLTSILSGPIRLNNSQQIHYLYSIKQHNLNRTSKNAVSFFSRKTCQKPYSNTQAPTNIALSLTTTDLYVYELYEDSLKLILRRVVTKKKSDRKVIIIDLAKTMTI